MNKVLTTRERPQSPGEEFANSVSHGVGLVVALIATPVLIVTAAQRGGTAAVVGASVFTGTMVLLYLSSTLYHTLPRNKAKRVLWVLDHGAIFLLIAGTYTPFTLGVLQGAWGWTLLGLVWSLAVIGIVLKAVGGIRYPVLSTMPLPRHGVANPDRGSTPVAARAPAGPAVARGRGTCVNRRRGVFRG